MRAPQIGISPEGWPCIALAGFSSLVFGALDWSALALFFLLITWFSTFFFRDPERVTPRDSSSAISPADGKVVRIKEKSDPMTGENRICISIFMSLFDVHVNRSPVKGKVESIRYWPGKFINASLDKASTDNERCGYLIRDSEENTWTMVQIAGLIARRIVCRIEIGDVLERGHRYGLIRFGSCVEIYLPQGYSPTVQIGDRVVAGQDVIARTTTASTNDKELSNVKL
jgi:phosphatidylserine decarboxylase